MKLPGKITGRNKIRDGAIVLYFKRDAYCYQELAEKFNLSERRILQILAKNHAFIKIDKEWEKAKRISRLQQWIKKNPDTKKDPMDVITELRKEIEGDSKHTVDVKETIKIHITNEDINDRMSKYGISIAERVN